MNSCGTDNPRAGPEGAAETPIPHICLIPENIGWVGRQGDETLKRIGTLYGMYTAFAGRFAHPLVLSTRYGLVPLDEQVEGDDADLEHLKPHERHTLLIRIEEALAAYMQPRRLVVCLAGGLWVKALRKMEIPMLLPLAGMSQAQRRRWFEGLADSSNFAIGTAVWYFGGSDVTAALSRSGVDSSKVSIAK